MNSHFSRQQIRVYEHDGFTRLFTQSDPNLANQALLRFNPAELFAQNEIKILDDDGEFTFDASRFERIDLMTDRLSVWDCASVIGVNVELTEGEFRESVKAHQRGESLHSLRVLSVFVSIVMAGGHRYFLWAEIAGGLSAIRMSRICSMIRQPQLIFGLRIGGIGVLNLARMTHFSMHTESPRAKDRMPPRSASLLDETPLASLI